MRNLAIVGVGNLGSKLAIYLLNSEMKDRVELLKLVDAKKIDDPKLKHDKVKTFQVDLSEWRKDLVDFLRGCDTLVQFAAQNPFPDASWNDSQVSMDITANVFEAASQANVRRIVFASSNHVMGNYWLDGVELKNDVEEITEHHIPKPGTKFHVGGVATDAMPYACAKLFGEKLGKCYAASRNMQVVVLRIGWCQPGENLPSTLSSAGTHSDTKEKFDFQKNNEDDPKIVGLWFRLMWLSNRDYYQVMKKAIESNLENGAFVIVNAMSNNTGMRWRVKNNAIGYEPQDDVTQYS